MMQKIILRDVRFNLESDIEHQKTRDTQEVLGFCVISKV